MKGIRIDGIGQITKGDDIGSFVKILNDFDNTGGYLILLSKDITFENTFDDWVENKKALELYFLESQWTIKWL